jgi:hypothetical protein
MNQGIERLIFRCIHILFSIPILGYICSSFAKIPSYAPAVRSVFLPVLALSGVWMWKGHAFRRLISHGSTLITPYRNRVVAMLTLSIHERKWNTKVGGEPLERRVRSAVRSRLAEAQGSERLRRQSSSQQSGQPEGG